MLLGKGWVRNNTVGLRARGHELDDLHQEANVAALKLPHRPEIAAQKRLTNLALGRRYLGSESARTAQVRTTTLDETAWQLLEERTTEVEEHDTQIAVRDAVRKLPDAHRQIVWLRFYEERRWDEIAKGLRCSKDTLRRTWEGEIAPTLREALA